MDTYVIIFGPTGTRLSDSIEQIAHNWDTEEVETRDIEDQLKRLPITREALEGTPAHEYKKISMYDVCWYLPRAKVTQLWQEAVKQCLLDLKYSDKPIKILGGHVVYYGGQRNEFYSVVDPGLLRIKDGGAITMSPSHVLLLIDDIYDMYTRLSKKNELYDYHRAEEFFYATAERAKMKVTGFSEKETAFLWLVWKVRVMNDLLYWRHTEILIAENFARQLRTKFSAWGIKQSVQGAISWLTDESSLAIYLSHPITEARRKKKDKGEWPDLVVQVNHLPELLLKKQIVLVMPTAIDELRLETELKKESLPQYTGCLLERWPDTNTKDKLIYTRPNGAKDTNYQKFFVAKPWDFQRKELRDCELHSKYLDSKVDALLRVFVQGIELNIAARDHLFVSHADGLLVFRPFYGGKAEISRGVYGEVSHWQTIVNLGVTKKGIVFVHFDSDVQSMIKAKKADRELSLHEDLVDELAGILKTDYGVSEKRERKRLATTLIKRGTVQSTESILTRGGIAAHVVEKIKAQSLEILRTARIGLLRAYLTNMIQCPQESFAVWVLKDTSELHNALQDIAHFFSTGNPRGNQWEEHINTLFPN